MNKNNSKTSCEELKRVRRLIVILLEKLENEISNPDDFNSEEAAIFWGGKENAISILNKLTQMLVKLIPLEKQLLEIKIESESEESRQEDIKILEYYVNKQIKKRKTKTCKNNLEK